MNRIINKFRNPIVAIVLMLSIVLIPIISSPFTEVYAEDVYQAYTKSGEYPASDHLKNPIYVRPDGSNAKGDVAYCFNDHRSFPDSAFSPRKTLYTKELGTAAKFEELADTERVNGESLYNGLVRVIYDGYPNNKSGIKERYGLTDGQFRQITQYAVWYYTDTFNMPARDTSGNNFTENEKNAFNDLVNSTTAIPAGTKLDIYRAKDNSYQNLLSGHFQPNTPQPQPQPTTKEVEFSKVKLGGTELAGAQIEIYKGVQKVNEWTSGTTSHKIQLEPGTYRFHEEVAPAGFLAVTDFTFTVKADGTVELGTIAQGETVVAASGKITVTDNAKPEPTTPGTTPKPGAKKPSVVVKSKSPKTGDEGSFAQYALLLLSSGLALSAIGYNRRKNVKYK